MAKFTPKRQPETGARERVSSLEVITTVILISFASENEIPFSPTNNLGVLLFLISSWRQSGLHIVRAPQQREGYWLRVLCLPERDEDSTLQRVFLCRLFLSLCRHGSQTVIRRQGNDTVRWVFGRKWQGAGRGTAGGRMLMGMLKARQGTWLNVHESRWRLHCWCGVERLGL